MKALALVMLRITAFLFCFIPTVSQSDGSCVCPPVCASTIIQLKIVGVASSEWKAKSDIMDERALNVDLMVEEVLKPKMSSIGRRQRLTATIIQQRHNTVWITDLGFFWEFQKIEPDKSYILFSKMEGTDIVAMMQSPLEWIPIDDGTALIEDVKHIGENADHDDRIKSMHLVNYLKESNAQHGEFLGIYAGDLIANDLNNNEDLTKLVEKVYDYRFTVGALRSLIYRVRVAAQQDAKRVVKPTERLAYMTVILLATEGGEKIVGDVSLPYLLEVSSGRSALRELKIDDQKKSALKAKLKENINSEARDNLKSLIDLLEGRQ
jgi:hypothetical protein